MSTVKTIFLHGLDSSGQGTKGRFFSDNFTHVSCPDFSGTLSQRLETLKAICKGQNDLTLIGSSFGGLMATCFATENLTRISRLILLAPALNFPDYRVPPLKLSVPTLLIIGKDDTITPAKRVVPLAKNTFSNLEIRLEDDDHMLHNSFKQQNWHTLLHKR